MVMSTEFLDYWYRRKNGYFRRMATNYEEKWEAIFTATKAKIREGAWTCQLPIILMVMW